ncbi:hypothetical protein ACC674_38615, partial [Rhizobium ruizarguesonis]
LAVVFARQHLLDADQNHLRKIRKDQLRVHRQYVLGPDLKESFDFTLMTAGQMPASVFASTDEKRMPG